MTDRLEEALVEVISRMETGDAPTPDEMRADYPDCWEEIRDVLDLRDRLADAGGLEQILAKARVASETRLRVVEAGRYEGFRLLGEGGMGTVYWALDTELNRQVAFKVVRPGARADRGDAPATPIEAVAPPVGAPASRAFETLKARFLQEAWVTAGLEHPGIAPVYEVGRTEEGVPYYTMRFVRGSRTLTSAMNDARGRPIEERLELLDPFLRVCDAMRYAHAHGVIHRDLKPDNVALGEFGEVVVLDWGIAKMRDRRDDAAEAWERRIHEFREASDLRTQRGALGTPGYMSPEAATGRVDLVDERSDVYSLGAILFQILTGRLPYSFRTYGELLQAMRDAQPPDPTSLDASVPSELSAICVRALSRERDARPASTDALATDVRAWLAKRARDHEIEALEREANAAMAATADLEGGALLRQLDRVHSAAAKVLDRAPDSGVATELVRESEVRRETGIRQREHATRRRFLRRGGVAVLAALLAGAAAFIKVEHAAAERRRTSALLIASIEAQPLHPTTALLLDRAALSLAPADVAAANQLRRLLADYHERAVLEGHSDAVDRAEFSAAGDRVVTGSADGTVRIWDTAGAALFVVEIEGARLAFVALSRKKDLILTTADDGVARLFDLRGELVAQFAAPGDAIVAAAVAPAGDAVVTVSAGGVVRLWDPSGTRRADLAVGEREGAHAVFSADGLRVAASFDDGSVGVWDVAAPTPTLLRVSSDLSDEVTALSFSPRGDRVLATCGDGVAWTWDVSDRAPVELRPADADVEAESARFSPDGGRILVLYDSGPARLFGAEGTLIAELRDAAAGRRDGDDGDVRCAAFSPDGRRIVTGTSFGDVSLWDAGGACLASMSGHTGECTQAAFSPDGSCVVTACSMGVARLWASEDGALLGALRGHVDGILLVAFSPKGDCVLTAASDRSVRLWDLAPREPIAFAGGDVGVGRVFAPFAPSSDQVAFAAPDGTIRVVRLDDGSSRTLRDPDGSVGATAWSPRGAILATDAAPDGTTRLWNPSNSEPGAALRTPGGACRFRGFSPDGSLVLTSRGADDGTTIQVWKSSGELVVEASFPRCDVVGFAKTGDIVLDVHHGGTIVCGPDARERRRLTERVPPSAFAPSGGWAADVGDDGVVRVLDSATDALRMKVAAHRNKIVAAVPSPDGRFVATAGWDRTARVLDVATGAIAVLEGHETRLSAAAYSSSGTILATASEDETIRLWDPASRRELARLPNRGGQATALAFSSDDRRLAARLADGAIRVWRIRTDDVIDCALQCASRDFTAEERSLYGDLLAGSTLPPSASGAVRRRYPASRESAPPAADEGGARPSRRWPRRR